MRAKARRRVLMIGKARRREGAQGAQFSRLAIKSFKKTFNSKHRAKLKIESQRYRNTKN